MNSIMSALLAVCGSALVCSLISIFVSNSGTKKILNLVLGAFMLCCLISPIKSAVEGFEINTQGKSAEQITATDDEAYSKAVINQTKLNLEQALSDLMLQNGVKINSCEINLALTDENSIIISGVSIYINNEYANQSDKISSITKENFGISPGIITV